MAERPEDLNLPNAVVGRIIKEAIPDGVNVSKEARLAISKAASVFVLYATSCSNNFALKLKRKTISAQDVLSAMEDMEFEQFVEPLTSALEAFRNQKKKKRVSTAGPGDNVGTNSAIDVDEEGGDNSDNEEGVTYQGEEKDDYVITLNQDNEEQAEEEAANDNEDQPEDDS